MEILPVFAEDGLDAGLAKYKALKADDTYAVKENKMNQAGYQLLQNGKIKEDIEVFMINVAEFPVSWNTYYSLGEAYMMDHQKDAAIANYKKIQRNKPRKPEWKRHAGEGKGTVKSPVNNKIKPSRCGRFLL